MNVLTRLHLFPQRNEGEPLVLHCLPPPSSSSASTSHAGPFTSTQPGANPSSAPDPTPPAAKSKAKGKASDSSSSTSVAALPKLVSIAEIIKREWMDVQTRSIACEEGREEITAPAREGLHQYTLLTTLEAIGLAADKPSTGEEDGDAEAEEMMRRLIEMEWLSGRAGKDRRFVGSPFGRVFRLLTGCLLISPAQTTTKTFALHARRPHACVIARFGFTLFLDVSRCLSLARSSSWPCSQSSSG